MTHDDPHAALLERVRKLASQVSLRHNYALRVERDMSDPTGRVFIQITCWRPDTFTGEYDTGYGGKAYLSPHAVDSEIVQTVFALYKGYDEHECRETFLYKGVRIYGPHIDVNALVEAATHIDARPTPGRTHDDGPDQQDQEAAGEGTSGDTGPEAAGQSDHGEAPVVELSFPDSWKATPPQLVRDDDPGW